MNVRTICLAILYDGKATGYEIRKLSVEGEYSYFIDASFGSIYPALAKMEAEGLVTSRIEPQDGKPAKKIYSITTTGRREFINSLFDQLGEDEYRGYGMESDLMRSREAGFAKHLIKPVDFTSLDEAIAEAKSGRPPL